MGGLALGLQRGTPTPCQELLGVVYIFVFISSPQLPACEQFIAPILQMRH